MENRRLLIIDDDADDRDLFIDAVMEVDDTIECITSRNGLLALEWLRNTSHPLPDLIFLDVRMPLLNGNKCLEEIKKDVRLSDIPVIIYTTSKDLEESKALKELGAVHFISKPTDAAEIYYLVALILEEHLFARRKS